MALSLERGMGTYGCVGLHSGFSHNGRKRMLRVWVTVKIAIALGLGLALSQAGWAQDPLNDVHIKPPPPETTAPAPGAAAAVCPPGP